MRRKLAGLLTACPLIIGLTLGAHAKAGDTGVHCQIDGIAFDSDPDTTHSDYVIPPGGKPPRFRILANHLNEATGTIGVQLKAHGELTAGSAPLSQEATWKSVVQMPKQPDSAITEGNFIFSHFEPTGDAMAIGSVQFKTSDAHHGECHFRLHMDVVDLGHLVR